MAKRWVKALVPFNEIEKQEGSKWKPGEDEKVRFRIAFRLRTERSASLRDIGHFMFITEGEADDLLRRGTNEIPPPALVTRMVQYDGWRRV